MNNKYYYVVLRMSGDKSKMETTTVGYVVQTDGELLPVSYAKIVSGNLVKQTKDNTADATIIFYKEISKAVHDAENK